MISGSKACLSLALALLIGGCAQGESGRRSESTDQPSLPPDLLDMTPRVVLETTKGRIVLELDREKAPKTVENVLAHVEGNSYDGLIFHRVIPGFMIQGGGFTAEMSQRQSSRPSLMNEANNGLKNVRGSIAMARTADPHSATNQFFINLVDNTALDFTSETPQGWGYTVFGHVVEGMEVVDAIAQVKTARRGSYDDVPVESVIIERAYVADE